MSGSILRDLHGIAIIVLPREDVSVAAATQGRYQDICMEKSKYFIFALYGI